MFDSVRGPLVSLFERAEPRGVILALQCSSAVHLGVDNLNVARHVSRFLEGRVSGRPLELTVDGDLLIIIERMIQLRGAQSLKITKVKGHADEDMVAVGRAVRVEDRVGNDLADRAADFGRRRVPGPVIDVRWRFLSACSTLYPIVLDLHRFSLPLLVLRLMMMVKLGLPCIPLFGPVGDQLRFVRFVFLLGSLLGFLALLVFEGMGQLVGLLSRLVMVTLVFGHILLGSWLSFALF